MEVGVGLFSTGGGRGRSNQNGDWGGEINYPIATIFDDVPGVVVTKKNQNGDWGVVNKSNRNYF